VTRDDLARVHSKNRKKVKQAITQVNRSLNEAIKTNNAMLEYVNTRVLLLLYVCYLETTMDYLIEAYPAQVSQEIRNRVASQRSEIDRWLCLVDSMFIHRYLAGRKTSLTMLNVGHTAYTRYVYVRGLTDTQVRACIEMRNKLSHGQWAVALNNDGSSKNQDITSKVWTLTKKDLMLMKGVVNRYMAIMENLIASKNAFEKYFDTNVEAIERCKQEYNRKYDWFINLFKQKAKTSKAMKGHV
jgi:hypothetical protein